MKFHQSRIAQSMAILLLMTSSAASADNILNTAKIQGVDRIVFLGDSITQAGDYVADFDTYLVSQGINIEVLNLGLGSETACELTESENIAHKKAAGFGRPYIAERLGRVLAETKPDLLIACYGMNDGSALPEDESGTQRYADAITHLRDAALKAGVRQVVLCTPPTHDAKGNASQKGHDENLTRYSEWLLSKKSDGWDVVDIHGPMRKALDEGRAKDNDFAFASDGVHPGSGGHFLMANSILTQFLGANLEGLSSAEEFSEQNGKKIRKLVHERMAELFRAWMNKIGHTRPGVPGGPGVDPGPTVQEANAKAAAITKQITGLQTAKD